jgi:hypothetical protein
MFGFKRLKAVQFLLWGAILLVVHTSVGAAPIDRSGTWDISLNGQWRFMLDGPEAEFFEPEFDVSGWSTSIFWARSLSRVLVRDYGVQCTPYDLKRKNQERRFFSRRAEIYLISILQNYNY